MDANMGKVYLGWRQSFGVEVGVGEDLKMSPWCMKENILMSSAFLVCTEMSLEVS